MACAHKGCVGLVVGPLLGLSRGPAWGVRCRRVDTLEAVHPSVLTSACHSFQMADFLLERGFKEVYNIVGGIDRFSKIVDPSVPEY